MLRITPIYGSSLSSSSSSSSLPSLLPVDGHIGGDVAGTVAEDGINVDTIIHNTGVDEEEDNPPEWLSSQVPTCTLVEYAGVRLLLNVGWDESLPGPSSSASSSFVPAVAAATKASDGTSLNNKSNTLLPNELPNNVDAILVCDSTLSSLGGLPFYFGACKSKTNRGNRAPRSLLSLTTTTATSTTSMTEEEVLRRHNNNNPPILATYPTLKMGQMSMYDNHASLSLDGHNPGYTLEDIDAVFSTDSFSTLKYSQIFYLPNDNVGGRGETQGSEVEDYIMEGSSTSGDGGTSRSSTSARTPLVAVTPHLSGHVVGGCYWVLRRLSDDATVVLAPTYHHAKEKHLAGSTLHKFGMNADALLTMPGGARGLLGKLYFPPPAATPSTNTYLLPPSSSSATVAKTQYDYQKIIKYNTNKKPILSPPMGNRSESEIIDSLMAALRRDGNVLLPVDASGRVLELLLILDRHWEKQRLGGAYNLIWVSPMSPNTIEYARSQLEWMAPPLGAQFDSQRGHPYALKHVSICSSLSEMEHVIRNSNGNPTAVLASGASMDHGPARDLLLKWGGNPDNLILITDSTRCTPRGDVWFHRHLRRYQQHRCGGGGVGLMFGGNGDENLAAYNDSSGAIGIAIDDAMEGTTTTDDKDGNEQQASLIGPALQPDSISAYTTLSQLLYHWCVAKASGTEMPDEVVVDVHVPHRAPLKGSELQAFLAVEEREVRSRQAEMEEKAMMKEIELARGRLRLGAGDGEEVVVTKATGGGDTAGGQTTAGGALKALAGGNTRPKKRSRFDQNLFIKFSKPVHMTFDICEEAVGIGQPDSVAKFGIIESLGTDVVEDDYGIAVKADCFVDIVTGVDPSKFAGKSSGRIGEDVMRRGLGIGLDGKNPLLDSSAGGVVEMGDNADGSNEEINEKMLEVADLSTGKGIIKGRNGRPPIKVSVIPRRLEVLAEIMYAPLEGRVDARAARQSVRALQPRHLVVIGGPRSNSLLLTEALRTTSSSVPSKGDDGVAHIPKDGVTVHLSVGHASYKVRLVDTPYIAKEEMDLSEKEVKAVEPYETKIGDCTVSLVDFVATGKKWAVDGSFVLAPRLHPSTLKQPNLMISTREVLLTDLRAEVTALGMKAEYGALSGYSQLIVNGKIVVRKDNSTGKLDVEGPLCNDFYTVRSIVKGQFVTV